MEIFSNIFKKIETLLVIVSHPMRTLPELKAEATKKTQKNLEQIIKNGFSEKRLNQLKEVVEISAFPDVQSIAIWLQQFFDEITETCWSERSEFLYKSRLDIAGFTKNEFEEFQNHLQDLEIEYITTVNDMIKKEVLKFAPPSSDSLSELSKKFVWVNPGDDTIH